MSDRLLTITFNVELSGDKQAVFFWVSFHSFATSKKSLYMLPMPLAFQTRHCI